MEFGINNTEKTNHTWFSFSKNLQEQQPSEDEKLKNSNVWDYAKNMTQAAAYMG